METFSALLSLCAGNSPMTGEFPSQWPVTRSFDVFFDLRLNKRMRCRWFETPSRSVWRHCNGVKTHQDRDNMTTILQTAFSNLVSCMTIVVFWFKFHRNLFPWVQWTMSQHWFRYWFVAEQATSHYLNQWRPSTMAHICVTRPQWVNRIVTLCATSDPF